MRSSREAGFPDDEGRRVRNWIIQKLKDAEQAADRILNEHPTGLEEPTPSPSRYLDLDDPDWERIGAERSKWRAMLDDVDTGGSAAFMRAHAEWTKAGEQ